MFWDEETEWLSDLLWATKQVNTRTEVQTQFLDP